MGKKKELKSVVEHIMMQSLVRSTNQMRFVLETCAGVEQFPEDLLKESHLDKVNQLRLG